FDPVGLVAGVEKRAFDGVGVELDEEVLHELPEGSFGTLDDPAALAPDAAAADVEDLDGGLQLVGVDGDEVGVGAVAEDDGLLLHDLVDRLEVIAQTGRALELELPGGLLHLPGELPDHLVGVAVHEGDETVDDVAVLLRGHAPDARGGALVDVAEQAGTAQALVPVVDALRAGPHRENTGEQVEGLAHSPGMGVGAEVAHPPAAGTTVEEGPRDGLPGGHGQQRIGLVVTVLDVEAGVETLDPRVLEL